MYGKIFDTIYDGTLVEDWRALITFQQMIVLCDADGTIDMTPHAISRRTGIPIEHIEAGIRVLENQDPYSRTSDEEGRRIVRLDEHRSWGWTIVNHNKYKNLQDSDTVRAQTRERVKRLRDKRKEDQQTVTDGNAHVTDGNAPLRYTDTNTNTKIKTLADSVADQRSEVPLTKTPPCQHSEIVKLYHEILPELRSIRVWSTKRQKSLNARWRENKERQTIDWWKRYFEYIRKCPFLLKPESTWCDLEWLINETNMIKIIEGKYEAAA